jgi:hypothetical protein
MATRANNSDLEQRITAALTGHLATDELAALVSETRASATAAEAAAADASAKAGDIVASPDADAAAAAMLRARLAADRLRNALSRLQVMHSERCAWDAGRQSREEFAEREQQLQRKARELWRQCPAGPHSADWQKFRSLQGEFDRLAYERAAFNEEVRLAACDGRPLNKPANVV